MKRRFPKPRTLLMLALLLVGGAIVIVAVAWGCDNFNQLRASEHALPSDDNDLRWWSANAPHGFESIPEARVFDLLTGFGREWSQWPQHPFPQVSRFVVCRGRSGWPRLSMEQSSWYDSEGNRTVSKHTLRFSILEKYQYVLATGIIWPGFAINTLFYAAILWGLFAVPFALRRRLRIKRGLCPKCAYPIGRSDNCSECGTAVSSREQSPRAE